MCIFHSKSDDVFFQRHFAGKFIICNTFPAGRSCRVGEGRCSFAHFREEVQFWILDRNGHFDIEQFIMTQSDNLLQGTINNAKCCESRSFILVQHAFSIHGMTCILNLMTSFCSAVTYITGNMKKVVNGAVLPSPAQAPALPASQADVSRPPPQPRMISILSYVVSFIEWSFKVIYKFL